MKLRALVPGLLLILSLILASRLSPHFLDLRYLLDTSTIYAETGLLALAMTLVIVSGNIDLSIGSIMVLVACLAAKMSEAGLGIPIVVLGSIGIGVVLGATNGYVIAKLRLPSFLMTLATMAIARGVAQAMLGPKSIKLPKEFVGLDQATVIGMPWPLIIFLAAAIAVGVLLHKSVTGRWIIGLGTNEKAALFSGVPIDRVKVLVFAISGLMAALAGLMIDSRLAVARHDLARGIELDAITIAVVGGAAIQGGEGTILGTTLALFLIMVIKTAMGVANIKAEYQLPVIGALLILAVLADRLRRNRS
ncbi:MAG: ABC transporter permease [Fimbriimonadaceae bacterium]